jgi:hypothetical protein
VQKYYKNAVAFPKELDEACYPAENVMTKAIASLDNAWPWGAGVAHFQGDRMNAGIVRITNSNKDTEVLHVDALPDTFTQLDVQLGINVFLSVPPSGGELEVARTSARSYEHIASLPADFDWSSLDEIKSQEPLLIKPEAGDLILINTRRPHATRIFPEGSGPRISVATFVGMGSKSGEKLLCWS